MDVSGLVLRDGDRVRASGRVVAVNGTAWFEPPLPVPAVHAPPERQPPPRPSGLGVPAIGIDLEQLERRREKHGAVEGWATLTGTWRDERLFVDEQGSEWAVGQQVPEWRQPPCPPPADGWPEGGADENLDVPTEVHGDPRITSIAMFRPDRRRTVLVIAAEDPSRVEAELRPRYGARLCVVPSRWTRQEIDQVLGRLRSDMRRWLIYTCGETVADDGQPLVTVDLTRVLPSLVTWAGSVPDGLLSVNAWLTPGSRSSRDHLVLS